MSAPTAVITGAASGIGRACRDVLRAQGWNVVVADRDMESRPAIAADGTLVLRTDVTSADDLRQLADAVRREFGRVDALVTCAGIADNAPLRQVSPDRFANTLAVNLVGTFAACRTFVDDLAATHGAIVTIGSVSGSRGSQHRAAYSASKGGVEALTRQLAIELASEGVRVNCVAPGSTLTPLVDRAQGSGPVRHNILRAIPLARYAEPREIAEVAAFLAGPQSSFVTGQVWGVDGGQLAYGGWRVEDDRE